MATNKIEFIFELYISNQEVSGIVALANLQKFCREYLHDNYLIIITDLLRQPEKAQERRIIVVPTIIQTKPEPIKRFIGDFSNFEKIKNKLGIGVGDKDDGGLKMPEALKEQEEIKGALEAGKVIPFIIEKSDINQKPFLTHNHGPYKTIVETMYEGAISLMDDGTIFYCNQSFATLINEYIDNAVGSSIYKYIEKSHKKMIADYINDATLTNCRRELVLIVNGKKMPVYICANKSSIGGVPVICVVVNDLSQFTKKKEIELNNLINDYDRMNNSLRISVNLTQKSDKAKSDFLASMSHELRTPLNSIIGYTEMIFNNMAGEVSSKQKQYLDEVLINSRYLLELINQLLNLSKIEANQIEFIPVSVDIHKLISEVSAGIQPAFKKRNIELKTYIDPKLRGIVIDPLKLKEVIYNFLSNAIKFTREGGKVQITVKPETKETFRLEVADTGIGIKDADLKRLFVPFQKLTPEVGTEIKGTGIGLSLSKLIIEAQGGKIGVNSIHGKGSTFYFVLPFKPIANSRYAILT